MYSNPISKTLRVYKSITVEVYENGDNGQNIKVRSRNNLKEIPQIPPDKNHVDSIIKFANEWNDEEDIVVHCWCGVSRSMATATYLLCKSDKHMEI